MTIQAGDYVLGLRWADGAILAMPATQAVNGDYCVLAETADAQWAAMRAIPMRSQDVVGYWARTADGLVTPFGGGSAATCIPMQDLGFGLQYMLYPPFPVQIANLTATPQPGRDAFIGAWADEIAGQPFYSYYTSSGIGGAYQLNNLNLAGNYPFLADLPHHLESGVRSVDLAAVVPSDGIWFHSEPMPFVMPMRRVSGPGVLHNPSYHPLVGTDESMGLPMDIRSQMQVFLNFKAALSLPAPTTMRLAMSAYVVVLIGKMLDFYWAPPLKITHPLGDPIDCLTGSLPGTGLGTACETTTAAGGIGSLECFCVCQIAQLWMCRALELSINALEQSNQYSACGTYPNRTLREAAVHGGQSAVNYDVPWPAGQEVTLANLQARYGFTGTLSEWIAGLVTSSGLWPTPLSIDNSDDPDRLQTTISATATLGTPASEIPAELEGTQPLPATVAETCLPVLPEVHLLSGEGWLRDMERRHLHAISIEDCWAIGKNPNIASQFPIVVAGRNAAYNYVCRLWANWQNIENKLAPKLTDPAQARAAFGYTNVPLRTDCFPGGGGNPPGYDPESGEFVFGYTGGCPNLFGDGAVLTDLAQYDFEPGGPLTTNVDPPTVNPGCWKQITQGGLTVRCGYYEAASLCMEPDYPYWCDDEPPDFDSTCRVIEEAYYDGSGYPRIWIIDKPDLEVRVKLENCYLSVRALFDAWVILERTCYHAPDPDLCPGGCYHADLPDNRPSLTHYGWLRVDRGGEVKYPADIDYNRHDWEADPTRLLTRNLWSQMQSTGRLLGGCLAANPGYCDVAGNGNSLRIYL